MSEGIAGLRGSTLESSAVSGADHETAVTSPRQTSEVPTRALRMSGSIGRYVVLEEVGTGAMGRVLRAYDPKLQREVALKEVRRGALNDDGRARLVAEARAMAQLSHPNVVAVYDVEESDEVVLVMELVAGQTLADWVRSGGKSWKDVVDRYVAAGRGLAAAHAAGLLHRDFKPKNVLISHDDVVKVTDFGLAKPQGTLPRSSSDEISVEHEPTSLRAEGLTEVGVVMGTPRYMAPEQHRGDALTPAIDQYAFCVAVWEALCGDPPFTGPHLERRKHEGPPPWPARRGRSGDTPRAVVEALRRGLSVDPAQRYSSMNVLLDALSHEPRDRTKMLVALAGVGALAAGGATWQAWKGARAQRCSGAEAQLGAAWDENRRSSVQRAITSIDKAYAAGVWEHTAARIDAYATDWMAMHTEACEATTVRGEQSSAVMDLRMACLHRARVELDAVTAVLADADADVVNKAHEVSGALPPLSRCADVDALQAEVEPPPQTEAEAVTEARAQLAAAQAATKAGRYAEARAEVDAAQQSLSEVQYGPVRTEIALARGRVLEHAGEYADAEAAYQEALGSAGQHRQWLEMADAASGLLFVVGWRQLRFDEGLRYLPVARGLAAGEPIREARVHKSLGAILGAQGKHAEAEAEYRRALAVWEKALGSEHPDVAMSRDSLGNALREQGKYEEAEAELRRALALKHKALGPEHPGVALSHNNLANLLYGLGKYEEAEVEQRRALALMEKALGPDHPDVAMSRNNLGGLLYAQGRYAEAEAEFVRALELYETVLGSEHPDVAMSRNNLAAILQAQGKYAEAEVEHRRALAHWEKTLGPGHPNVASSRNNLGLLLKSQGKHAAAEVELRRALELRVKALGPEHPEVAMSHNNLGNVLQELGRYEEAEAEHRRALALTETIVGAEHPDVAKSRNNLGQILHGQGKHAEAEVEHRQALAVMEKALGAEHPDVDQSRSILADFLLDRGGAEEARSLAEEVWARRQREDTPPAQRAEAAFLLARVLWASSEVAARGRARDLARQSLDAHDEAGQTTGESAQAVRQWLEQRRAASTR